MTSEQLDLFDVIPLEHTLHLENDLDGIKGTCPCGYSFHGAADAQELIQIISRHCAPISE